MERQVPEALGSKPAATKQPSEQRSSRYFSSRSQLKFLVQLILSTAAVEHSEDRFRGVVQAAPQFKFRNSTSAPLVGICSGSFLLMAHLAVRLSRRALLLFSFDVAGFARLPGLLFSL